MQPLTKRQAELLGIIKWCLEHRGIPPSLREMADGMDLHSTNAPHALLRALKKKGYIAWDHGKARTMRVLVHETPGGAFIEPHRCDCGIVRFAPCPKC